MPPPFDQFHSGNKSSAYSWYHGANARRKEVPDENSSLLRPTSRLSITSTATLLSHDLNESLRSYGEGSFNRRSRILELPYPFSFPGYLGQQSEPEDNTRSQAGGYGAILAVDHNEGIALAARDYSSCSSTSEREASQNGCKIGHNYTDGVVLGTWIYDVCINPTQSAVAKLVDAWYIRWTTLAVLPAGITVLWCAIPIPQYPVVDDDEPLQAASHHAPGRGYARVLINFWCFLTLYYVFYNLTALFWITKLFNLFGLNWWPRCLGFPLTIAVLEVFSLAIPIPIYLTPSFRRILEHHTTWVAWTFIIMALPVAVALINLLAQKNYFLPLRLGQVFDTQWSQTSLRTTNDDISPAEFLLHVESSRSSVGARVSATGETCSLRAGKRWWQRRLSMLQPWTFDHWRVSASTIRFTWFSLALLTAMMAYVLGEIYAEVYLRTLPHNNFETIAYVYSWVGTIYLLDGLTAWILGAFEGGRVGSYPLSWVFKLYFTLMYQIYVRALYARLRSPSQFVVLQLMSSGLFISLTPVRLTKTFHQALCFLRLCDSHYAAYQKLQLCNIFIRGMAENASMITFIGAVVVLHFGSNKGLYPYFAFDDEGPDGRKETKDPYDFNLTFYAANVTWACELVAQLVVRVLVRMLFEVDIVKEGKNDLILWPELLPTSIVVMLHVLQNMLFSIIRLRFR